MPIFSTGRIARFFAAIALAITIVFSAFKLGKREEKLQAGGEQIKADLRTAKKTEAKVAKAISRNDADERPVNDRLQSKGRLRD